MKKVGHLEKNKTNPCFEKHAVLSQLISERVQSKSLS
jgi:hypothetical protein